MIEVVSIWISIFLLLWFINTVWEFYKDFCLTGSSPTNQLFSMIQIVPKSAQSCNFVNNFYLVQYLQPCRFHIDYDAFSHHCLKCFSDPAGVMSFLKRYTVIKLCLISAYMVLPAQHHKLIKISHENRRRLIRFACFSSLLACSFNLISKFINCSFFIFFIFWIVSVSVSSILWKDLKKKKKTC